MLDAPCTPTPAPDKRLDCMNSLRDMGHFPVAVHAGATFNVLVTLCLTHWVRLHLAAGAYSPSGRPEPGSLALPAWIAVVLFLNLMPVVALRAVRWRCAAPMPTVATMDFWGDQHRFADWVYLAASANMAFWITLGWTAFTLAPFSWTLPALLALALVCTFSPVWVR